MLDLKRMLPAVFALGSGLVTCVLLYAFLGNQPKAKAARMDDQTMVVAAHPINASQALKTSDLRVVHVQKRLDGSFADASELDGRMLIADVPVGQPILDTLLVPSDGQQGLWYHIDKGKRAMTVAVNEVVGVGGFLAPGRHVDVISVVNHNDAWRSRTIVQDVDVLAIAQTDREDKPHAQIVTSATLMVTPEQAEQISLATGEGQIRLAMRAPNDNAMIPAPAPAIPAVRTVVVPHPVYYAAPAPKLPDPGIEVIRGTATEIVHP
ncbi:MAG TPA: Flp pilus assembly protein CpaB [Oscillatoriaceae cyanobacterium]